MNQPTTENDKLAPEEIEILEKQIRVLQDSNFHKLLPRLHKFFKEPPATFAEKVRAEFNSPG